MGQMAKKQTSVKVLTETVEQIQSFSAEVRRHSYYTGELHVLYPNREGNESWKEADPRNTSAKST